MRAERFPNRKSGTWCGVGIREVPCLSEWNEVCCGDRPQAFRGHIWSTVETMCTDTTMGSQVTAKRFQRGTQARAREHCPPTVKTFRREVKPNHHHRSAEEYVRFFALNVTPTSLTTREIEEASAVAGSHSVVRSDPPEPIRSTALPDGPWQGPSRRLDGTTFIRTLLHDDYLLL